MTNISMTLNTLEWGKQGHQMILTLNVMVGAYPLPPSPPPYAHRLVFPCLPLLVRLSPTSGPFSPPAPLSQNSVSSIICLSQFHWHFYFWTFCYSFVLLSLFCFVGLGDNLPFPGLRYPPLRFKSTRLMAILAMMLTYWLCSVSYPPPFLSGVLTELGTVIGKLIN